ncbi:FtsX-like permease family protein [Promicromonospora sp. MEB111]|uniref:FtsX-like permease family protein n=1 Tax=Promicromonospora sp. MEB111 TaxID=3040301 RepID=UPI0025512879|nr:FtsX-like permease family protein [Promicromonospora sp. MEB111]
MTVALLWSDLVEDRRVWTGTFGVLVAAGLAAGIPATLIETAWRLQATERLALLAITGTVIVLTLVSVLAVLASAVRTVIELRRQRLALWALVGMVPAQTARLLLVEVAIVAVLATAVGTAAAVAVCPAVVRFLLHGSSGLDTTRPTLSWVSAALAAACAVLVAVVAAVPLVRRASQTAPLALLRRSRRHDVRTWSRVAVGVSLTAVAVSMMLAIPRSLATGAAQAVLIGPVLVAATSVTSALFAPGFVRSWTRLVPDRLSLSWALARAAVVDDPYRSSAAITAFLVAIGLPWTFLAGQQTVAAATGGGSGDPRPLAILLGGPTVLAVTGAAAGLLMASRVRERDRALLTVAGAGRAFSTRVALFETLILVVSAALLATVIATVVSGGTSLLLAGAGVRVAPELAWGVAGLLVGVCLVLALATTVATITRRSDRTLAVILAG